MKYINISTFPGLDFNEKKSSEKCEWKYDEVKKMSYGHTAGLVQPCG